MNKINGSVIVVADTHFGLHTKKQFCDPIAFSDFLNWLKRLETKEEEILRNLGESINLRPPKKLILLGDILELWDASRDSIIKDTRSIIKSLFNLNCEKIYVLGNHDYDLVETAGEYSLGASNINITDQEYDISMGDKKYLFLHGHQFDRYFTLPAWKIMPAIRRAALAYGSINWLFLMFFFLDLAFVLITGLGGIANILLLILLFFISMPFLVIKFGRKYWNKLRSIRYNPEAAFAKVKKDFKRWWNKFEGKESARQNLNIVYGHTHTIAYWKKPEGNNTLKLWNIPAWIKDLEREKVFRHAFLYIDEKVTEFFGWDKTEKKPFLIPRDIVEERRESGKLKLDPSDRFKNLKDIGWPQELIDKWKEHVSI